MQRIEKNILHHAKQRKEQRKLLTQKRQYLEFKYGTYNINTNYPYD